MFQNILKLFKKPPVVRKNLYFNRYFAVSLEIKGEMLVPVGATPMDPSNHQAASEISFYNGRLSLFEIANNEGDAMRNGLQRAFDKHGDKVIEFINTRLMQRPATKQDIQDLRNEIASLRELVTA